jgi:hypothetical protein
MRVLIRRDSRSGPTGLHTPAYERSLMPHRVRASQNIYVNGYRIAYYLGSFIVDTRPSDERYAGTPESVKRASISSHCLSGVDLPVERSRSESTDTHEGRLAIERRAVSVDLI